MKYFLNSPSFEASYRDIYRVLNKEIQTLVSDLPDTHKNLGYLVLVNIITKMRIEIKNIQR